MWSQCLSTITAVFTCSLSFCFLSRSFPFLMTRKEAWRVRECIISLSGCDRIGDAVWTVCWLTSISSPSDTCSRTSARDVTLAVTEMEVKSWSDVQASPRKVKLSSGSASRITKRQMREVTFKTSKRCWPTVLFTSRNGSVHIQRLLIDLLMYTAHEDGERVFFITIGRLDKRFLVLSVEE